jgi:hypothetical protein
MSLSNQSFIDQIIQLEQEMFPDDLDPDNSMRMKSDQYSWLYRPSHHIKTGLITEVDVDALKNGKRLLSIGAFPAHLEKVMVAYGVPSETIVIADSDSGMTSEKFPMNAVQFDCTKEWPELGMFDIIIFPESLCIALTDTLKKEDLPTEGLHPTDAREAELLFHVLKNALQILKPDGIIRANGPQSHPTVCKAAEAMLDKRGLMHVLHYQRYFLTMHK